ncbi:MAG: hypothetical protein WBL61_19415 [Bryobacteraceae bacterium]
MNCEQYWNDVAGPEPGEGFDTHLAACPSCAARWAAERPVTAGLRLLAAEMKHVSAPPRVEARLVRAYRERYRRRVPAPREVHRWWAAAAALLLVAGALSMGVRQPPSLVAANSAVAPAGIEEEEGAFLPLPNAAGFPQDEDVDLVRVELPRSATTALGMPASDDSDAESVEAEVLVGPDGMARAVRFFN